MCCFLEDDSGQIITTSAEVTQNGGLIRELPQNPLNSGLGIILICPDDSFPLRKNGPNFQGQNLLIFGMWKPKFTVDPGFTTHSSTSNRSTWKSLMQGSRKR